ncbi:MAG: hypothetical protein ACX93O_03780 [Flagellimonas sp.]
MKVYAEYFNIENGNDYRRKTLLQFGDNTDLIGSAVLINPGSAEPIGSADLNFIQAFYQKNHNLELEDLSLWKSFNPDPTMGQLAKLFNGWYAGKERTLSGVIQLFNCFYLKEQDLDLAMALYHKKDVGVFNESSFFKDRPVYFGWGNTGKYGKIKDIALNIFNSYNIQNTPIYHSAFEENCFYHPGYLNRSYKKTPRASKSSKNFLVYFELYSFTFLLFQTSN